MEAITFTSEGYALSGVLFGAAAPGPAAVVLCHGAFERKENWFPYARQLAGEGLAAFAFDFIGHGASEGLRGTVDMHIWPYNIRDALTCLGVRGYRNFGLVGWGSGGTAIVLAAAHDRRVCCGVALSAPICITPSLSSRLVLSLAVGANKIKQALWKKPLTLSRTQELADMRVAVDDDVNARYVADPNLRSHLQRVPVRESLDSVWCDITRGAQKVKVPFFVMHGSEDAIYPLKQSQNLYQTVQGLKELRVIQNSGHAIHLDGQRDVAYKLMAQWLKRYLLRPAR
jgi:alpha-beta hydrolase superfamily lysophospholipase